MLWPWPFKVTFLALKLQILWHGIKLHKTRSCCWYCILKECLILSLSVAFLQHIAFIKGRSSLSCNWSASQDRKHYDIFFIINPKIVAYITGYLYWRGFESTLQHDLIGGHLRYAYWVVLYHVKLKISAKPQVTWDMGWCGEYATTFSCEQYMYFAYQCQHWLTRTTFQQTSICMHQ